MMYLHNYHVIGIYDRQMLNVASVQLVKQKEREAKMRWRRRRISACTLCGVWHAAAEPVSRTEYSLSTEYSTLYNYAIINVATKGR